MDTVKVPCGIPLLKTAVGLADVVIVDRLKGSELARTVGVRL